MEKAISLGALSYAEINFVCIGVTILYGIAAVTNMRERHKWISRYMVVFGIMYVMAFSCDAFGRLLIEKGLVDGYVSVLFTGVYSTCLTIAACSWFLYSIVNFFPSLEKNYKVCVLLSIPAIAELAYIWGNVHNIIQLFMNDITSREIGVWFGVQKYWTRAFYIVSLLLAIIGLVRFSGSKRRKMSAIAVFAFCIIVFEMLQEYTGRSFKCVGYTAALAIYVWIRLRDISRKITEENTGLQSQNYLNEQMAEKSYAVIQGLVDTFEFVCYIDVRRENAEIYKSSERFSELADECSSENISSKIDYVLKKCIAPDAYEEFRKSAGVSEILDIIKEKGSYSIETKFLIDGEEKYYSVDFSKDHYNDDGLIVGVMDIDSRVRSEINKKEKDKEREYSVQLEATITDRTIELHEKAKSLNQINEDIIELLGNITEARDTESGEHIRRVKGFTNILANHVMEECPEYGLTNEKIGLITSASALHDIGKIMIPDAVLLKPGRFTPGEFEIMKSHCEKGCEMLKRAPRGWSKDYLDFSMEICHYHHEKWDGNGYPEGLVGDEIPISAQIVAIADCFDALTTKRVYKDAYSVDEAYRMILGGECGSFSSKLLTVFEHSHDEFVNHIYDINSKYSSDNAGGVVTHALSDVTLLLVEDNELTRNITKEILEEEGAKVYEADCGQAAVDVVEQYGTETFDAILMDLMLPDFNGWEVAKRIRNMDLPRADIVPIIALTSSNEEEKLQYAYEAGMNSYTPKPVSVSSITKLLIKSMKNEQDILKKRQIEDVNIQTSIDSLTGIKNLSAYLETIEKMTNEIKQGDDIEFGLVLCDINQLNKINETYGHDVGDIYIKNCCKLVCDSFAHSPVFRAGGDEFAVILTGEDYRNRERCMEKVRDYMHLATRIEKVEDGKASVAVGLAVYDPDNDKSVSDVTKRAEENMVNNKRMLKFSGMYEQ